MDNFEVLFDPARVFLAQIIAFVPRLTLALAVLVGGWLLAKVARLAVAKGLRAMNFNVLTERSGIDEFLHRGGTNSDAIGIFGVLVYWLVILTALVIAFNSVGLAYVTDLLGTVVMFVPKVIVALLIVSFGAYFARFVRNTVVAYGSNIGVQDARLLGALAHYAIMVFVVLIALDQVSVGGNIIRQSFLIILAGVVFALALAFGLGGKAWAAARLAHWWPEDSTRDQSPP